MDHRAQVLRVFSTSKGSISSSSTALLQTGSECKRSMQLYAETCMLVVVVPGDMNGMARVGPRISHRHTLSEQLDLNRSYQSPDAAWHSCAPRLYLPRLGSPMQT